MSIAGHRRRHRIAITALIILVVTITGFSAWYRLTYYAWPIQSATSRINWCGRDYENASPAQNTWKQVTKQSSMPLQAVGDYPPLAANGQQMFAAILPIAKREAVKPPLPCSMIIYMRTSSGRYLAYTLQGGP